MKCEDIHDDLALMPYDELDPTRRKQIEEHLGSCPACAVRAREFCDVKEHLDMATLALPSTDLSARVRAGLEAAPAPDRSLLLSRHKAAIRPRWPRVAAIVLPVAALLGVWWFFGRSRSALAWVDVIRAMNAVQQFHVKVFGEDEGGSEKFEIDIYFRQPNTWRASGMGCVQFADNGSVKLFDVDKKNFVDPATTKEKPLPPDFSRGDLQRHGLLKGLLTMFFHGKLPPGQPVRTAIPTLSQDLEVFDYAHDGFRQWVRVWVLKASRLPIRLTACYPQSDERMLCLFDYSVPQPDRFFDVDAFIKEVDRKRLRRARHIYRTGLAPLAGKPRGRTQIHDLQGYKAPELLSIAANSDGDLRIVSTDPMNRHPGGWRVDNWYWRELRDNWGNVYLRHSCNRQRGVAPTPLTQFYSPVPPLKEGEGGHTITLRYIVEDPYKRRLIRVSEEVVLVPARSDTVQDWRGFHVPSQRKAMLDYTVSTGTAIERLEFTQRLLDENPSHLTALREKGMALYDMGLRDRFQSEFERDYLEDLLTDFKSIRRGSNLLHLYLHYLLERDRRDEAIRIGERMEAARKAALSSPEERKKMRRYVDGWPSHASLGTFAEWPRLSREFEKAKKPTVKEVVYSKDGILAVTYRRPRLRRGTDYGEWMPSQRWFDSQWRRLGSLGDGKLVHVLAKGEAKTFALKLKAPFAFSDEKEPRMFLDWEMKVDVPAPTIERMAERHPHCAKSRTSLGTQASWLYDSGQYREAFEKYREARDHEYEGYRGDPMFVESMRRSWACRMARCLIKLGQLDEAETLLTEIEAGKGDPRQIDDPWERGKVLVSWRCVDVARLMLQEARRGALKQDE